MGKCQICQQYCKVRRIWRAFRRLWFFEAGVDAQLWDDLDLWELALGVTSKRLCLKSFKSMLCHYVLLATFDRGKVNTKLTFQDCLFKIVESFNVQRYVQPCRHRCWIQCSFPRCPFAQVEESKALGNEAFNKERYEKAGLLALEATNHFCKFSLNQSPLPYTNRGLMRLLLVSFHELNVWIPQYRIINWDSRAVRSVGTEAIVAYAWSPVELL